MDKTPLTAKERQAKLRYERSEQGLKSLSVGFVHERYHDAIKKLVSEINEGKYSEDLNIKYESKQPEKEQLLERELYTAKGMLVQAQVDYDKLQKQVTELNSNYALSRERLSNKEKEINSFKKIFGNIYLKK